MKRASRWLAWSLLLSCWLGAVRGAAAAGPDVQLAAEVGRMAKVGSCSSPAFSPDGLQIAFVSNLSGLPQVWTVAADGGWPQPVTALDDHVGQVRWSPDGSWLAFSLAPGGGMNTQVYVVRPDGKMAYVSCTASGQVAAIDLAQWNVANLIDAGKGADGLTWAK